MEKSAFCVACIIFGLQEKMGKCSTEVASSRSVKFLNKFSPFHPSDMSFQQMIEGHRKEDWRLFGYAVGVANRENESQALILNIDVFPFPRKWSSYVGSAATQPAGTGALDTF